MPTAKRAAKQAVKKGAGRKREKPGATGAGEYYHLEVRPSEGFSTFRAPSCRVSGMPDLAGFACWPIAAGLPGETCQVSPVNPSGGRSRTHDVGEEGGLQRVAGQRADGSWETQKWLISKEMAHVEGGRLVADTQAARDVLRDLGSAPEHIEGDRFRAQPEAAPAR